MKQNRTRPPGQAEHTNRSPEHASRIAPGKVTLTSRLRPESQRGIQRKPSLAQGNLSAESTPGMQREDGAVEDWMCVAMRPDLHQKPLMRAHMSEVGYAGDEPREADMLGARAARASEAPNRTGLPDDLKSGIESLSGMDLSDVRVHANSDKPAQLNALAYTQGCDIHVAPGQERHLPHEAWHVVQQKQGRVRPTLQLRGQPVNDAAALEREADRMGGMATRGSPAAAVPALVRAGAGAPGVVQRATKSHGKAKARARDRRRRSEHRFHHLGPSQLGEPLRGRRRPGVVRAKYLPGSHGYKHSEQARLSAQFDFTVSGATHESEHAIGFEPLNRTSGLKRGKAGRARMLENRAPAYQEVKAMHREHIGTGTQAARDGSGMNSQEYRDAQRTLVESGDVSSAVQLNQLGYSHQGQPFQSLPFTPEARAANDSYDAMVRNLLSVTYAQHAADVSVSVDPRQRAEMYLARRAAQTGAFPSVDEENAARTKFGLPPLPTKQAANEKVDHGRAEGGHPEAASGHDAATYGASVPSSMSALASRAQTIRVRVQRLGIVAPRSILA